MTTNTKNILKATGILLIGLLLGWILFGGNNTSEEIHDHSAEQAENTIWTCSMHPQIKQSEAGKCPLCGMDLIPLENQSTDMNSIEMTENAMKLANIQTMVVGTKNTNKEIRLNGKVQIDERKLYAQTTHIPGRIEQLTINFTGDKVNRGQTLAMVYSPELVTAQEELLQANAIKSAQPDLFAAAKQKLRNWKISDNTISKIVSSGKAIQKFPITADVSGIVTAKKVALGDYVNRGMPLYEIADLTSVWILFDVYESDMIWVKVGDKVSYTLQSFPGETFEGTISFIDPMIHAQTRVATARVEVKNVGNKLKPEMFASGIIKDHLSKTASQEIVIPKSAIMWTGERSIVYIKNKNSTIFTLREVTLGTSLGDSYSIKDGLENGEEIVVNGTFTVDAASQLAGKPSMMNTDGGKAMTGHIGHNNTESTESSAMEKEEGHSKMNARISVSKEFQQQLNTVFDTYLAVKEALVNDNATKAQKLASELLKLISKVDMNLLTTKEAHTHWMAITKEISNSSKIISSTSEIETQRIGFINLSKSISKSVEIFGINKKVYQQFCPMANSDKGAIWLSSNEKIMNPYFGASMLSCGTVQKIIE
ncbi:efflux RND transporter periplasmic adaptor subunit [Lutibacter sp.]|uniref:efflux RND transporter periplasmic adaptor subunit n=1 Tax=Lutibacter sp. TaxID=1925666 RepID=UPI001A2C05AE|nr:efflux RND transporter periplasmic adaptor subunit [Lutibacter sp.]MBI9039940.1 efflux RND transporter periplasmic adaptor subunit [Lutibacter sp.]